MEITHDKDMLVPVRIRHYTQHNPKTEPYLFWLSVMTNSELNQVQKISLLMSHGLDISEAPGVTP